MVRQDSLKYAPDTVYKYRWLDQALEDFEQEIGYVLYEFGLKSARKAETVIHERVTQLCSFPYLGISYEGLQLTRMRCGYFT
jgi:plasmid stabilization system protein ParE